MEQEDNIKKDKYNKLKGAKEEYRILAGSGLCANCRKKNDRNRVYCSKCAKIYAKNHKDWVRRNPNYYKDYVKK